VPEEDLDELLVASELARCWNARVNADVTVEGAPELPSRIPSNSLVPDAVARLVRAAIVAAAVGFEAAVGTDASVEFAAEPTLEEGRRAEAVGVLLIS
jgi:hypothetical protein